MWLKIGKSWKMFVKLHVLKINKTKAALFKLLKFGLVKLEPCLELK